MSRHSHRLRFVPGLDIHLEHRCIPSVGTFNPTTIREFYAWNQTAGITSTATYNKNAGANQTIAIVDAFRDDEVPAELAGFDHNYGLRPPPTLQTVNMGSATSNIWPVERALDVEWVHADAPAARILIVNAASDSGVDMLAAVSYAVNHASDVSLSWGSPAFAGDSDLGFFFQSSNPNARTFIAASAGDTAGQLDWPADMSKPAITLSIGGTTGNSGAGGKYLGERLWPDSGTHGAVGYVSDPNSGFPIYLIDGQYPSGVWGIVGGTSDAAPQEAAMIAIVDQQRRAKHELPLSSADVANAIHHDMPAADFHRGHGIPGAGSFVVNRAVRDLVRAPLTKQVQTVSQSPPTPPNHVQPLLTTAAFNSVSQ